MRANRDVRLVLDVFDIARPLSGASTGWADRGGSVGVRLPQTGVREHPHAQCTRASLMLVRCNVDEAYAARSSHSFFTSIAADGTLSPATVMRCPRFSSQASASRHVPDPDAVVPRAPARVPAPAASFREQHLGCACLDAYGLASPDRGAHGCRASRRS